MPHSATFLASSRRRLPAPFSRRTARIREVGGHHGEAGLAVLDRVLGLLELGAGGQGGQQAGGGAQGEAEAFHRQGSPVGHGNQA